MIRDDVYGEVPPAIREAVDDVHTCGKQLLGLINDVLDLSKIEAGRMELALGDYSVEDVVNTVRFSLRSLAAEKGLDLVAAVPPDLPVAFGDGKRITQCLMNLAGNALKFTREGRVEIRVERQGESLTFAVSDTGIGIPPDQLEHIFEEFRQVDATITREFGGTGLGLPITRKFVELHDGRIWVESEAGKGSTFFFTVPVRVAREGTA
jgi:signal transduction histidine kinase